MRYLVETHLALGDVEHALGCLQEVLSLCGTEDPSDLRRGTIRAELLELRADCLQLLDRGQESLDMVWLASQVEGQDSHLSRLRLLTVRARARGLLPFWQWLRLHLLTVRSGWRSEKSEGTFLLSRTRQDTVSQRKLLEAFLLGGQEPAENIHAALSRISVVDPLRPYYRMRVAQRWRTMGRRSEADLWLARLYLEDEMRGQSSLLVFD